MLVRAMILGLEIDLISPSKNPFYKNNKTYDFVAMTPMQAYHSLADLGKVKKLIVGGALCFFCTSASFTESKFERIRDLWNDGDFVSYRDSFYDGSCIRI